MLPVEELQYPPAKYESKASRLAGKSNSLPEDKILDWSKLKQIADNILKCI